MRSTVSVRERTRTSYAASAWFDPMSRRTFVPRRHWSPMAVVAAVSLLIAVTFLLWVPKLARDLVCEETLRPSDAILVENFDPGNYLVFERAGELRKADFGRR